MAKVLVTEDYLSDIGDAIRGKLGGSTHYTPGQMASAIGSIPTVDPTLISKSISANGTYNADDDNADGYDSVNVNVQNSYSAQDEGKVVSSGALVAQESQNVSQNGTYDTTLKNQVVVAVPNSYSVSDEGKVVFSGELVSQTSRNVTQNGTYDTTKNNQITVNVSGGGDTDAIVSFDFTKLNETIHNVVFNQNGASFSTQQGCVLLITPKLNDITIEIGIPSLQLSSGSHRRFVMSKYDEGFIYRSSGVWAIYNGSWEESNVTDGAFLDNSILKIYIDGNDKWHFYKNDVLFFEPNGQIPIYSRYEQTTAQPAYGVFLLGSNNGYSLNTGTFSYVRIYNGEHIG